MLLLVGLVGAAVVGSVAILSAVPEEATETEDLPEETADTGEAEPEIGTEILDAAAVQIAETGEGGIQATGTDAADRIEGTDVTDQIAGLGCADTLLGNDGDDFLYGHDGADSLAGGAGDHSLEGGLGDDQLEGGAGADALHGREGADRLSGGAGADTLFGGDGDDLVSGTDMQAGTAPDADFVNGGDGDDTLVLGDGDTGDGGSGADDFILGHWIGGDGAAIMDFDQEADRMIVVYEDAAGPPGDFAHAPDPDNGGLVQLLSGEQVLATLPAGDAPPLGEIILVASSDAQAYAV